MRYDRKEEIQAAHIHADPHPIAVSAGRCNALLKTFDHLFMTTILAPRFEFVDIQAPRVKVQNVLPQR